MTVYVEGVAWLGAQALLVSSRVEEAVDDEEEPPQVCAPAVWFQSFWDKP